MTLPSRFSEPFGARHRSAGQTRSHGAIKSLNGGVQVEIQVPSPAGPLSSTDAKTVSAEARPMPSP